MSDQKEYVNKAITRRDFLYRSAAAGASIPLLTSNMTNQEPTTEREVKPPAEFKAIRDFIEEKIRTDIVPSLVIIARLDSLFLN